MNILIIRIIELPLAKGFNLPVLGLTQNSVPGPEGNRKNAQILVFLYGLFIEPFLMTLSWFLGPNLSLRDEFFRITSLLNSNRSFAP